MLQPESKVGIFDNTSKEKRGCSLTCFHTIYRHLEGEACWACVTCLKSIQSGFIKYSSFEKRRNKRTLNIRGLLLSLCGHDRVSQWATESERKNESPSNHPGDASCGLFYSCRWTNPDKLRTTESNLNP